MNEVQDRQLGSATAKEPQATEQDEGTYTGERSELGMKDGLGCLVASGGSITYHGQWSNGLPNGLGCLETPSFVYYGQMRRGRIDGFGQMTCLTPAGGDGVSFVGQFSAARGGAPDGPGVVVFPDGGCGLPRHEGFFDGWRMTRQALCPDAVSAGVRWAARARAQAASAAASAACDCHPRSRAADTKLHREFNAV